MMLGNLSIEQMERRMGIIFPINLKEILTKYHQDKATDIRPGYWHCFDMPFTMVCGNKDLAQLVYKELSPFVKDIKTPLEVAIVNQDVGYTKEQSC